MIDPLFGHDDLLQATGGHLSSGRRSSIRVAVASVVIDSRKVVPGSLFVALPGSQTDGHTFLQQAAQAGATAVMVRRDRLETHRVAIEALGDSVAVIVVDDTLGALQGLACYHLGRHPDLLRIAVTGSAGKTTTKEILGRILSHHGSTVISEGNLNSETGLPLALLQVRQSHRYGVFELGIDHIGEMDDLADIYRPHVALITNIGSAHSEQMISRQTIAREKKKVFKHIGSDGKGFLWEDDEFYSFLAEGVDGEIIPFGLRSTAGFWGSRDLGLDGTAIDWEGLQVRFPLFGTHNLLNALGAISLATSLGVDAEAVKQGLESTQPLFGRSQVLRGPWTVVADCYNSNPESLSAVLSYLSGLGWSGRKIAVLGSMLELGAGSSQAHRDVGSLICRLSLDRVFLFGSEMREADQTCQTECAGQVCHWTDDFDCLLAEVKEEIRPGDLVLVKGSRGVALERIVEPLTRVAV